MTESTQRIVGIVGMIGAGKTTVARQLADRGAVVIDADRLAHEALDDPAVRDRIVAAFGPAVLLPTGQIDRRQLAGLVFGPEPAQRRRLASLEAVVHPWVRAAIDQQLTALAASGRVVILDVPLLVQGGWHTRCDRLIQLKCEDSVRHARLAARGLAPTEIAAREAAWQNRYDPGVIADRPGWTVDTSGDLAYTHAQVDRVWTELTNQ